jgi:hypothetical protein
LNLSANQIVSFSLIIVLCLIRLLLECSSYIKSFERGLYGKKHKMKYCGLPCVFVDIKSIKLKIGKNTNFLLYSIINNKMSLE